MKRISIIAMVMLLFGTLIFTNVGISQANVREYELEINGVKLPKNISKVYTKSDGTIMIPIRPVAERLRYEVKWNLRARSVELSSYCIGQCFQSVKTVISLEEWHLGH